MLTTVTSFAIANKVLLSFVGIFLLEFVLPRTKKLAANSTVELVANMALAALQKAAPAAQAAVSILTTPKAA